MASNKAIVLITGANTGLGYEAVKALLATSESHILLGTRSIQKGQDAIAKLQSEVPNSKSTIEVLQVDVTSDESIEKAFNEVSSKHDHLDVLVNNAGVNLERDAQDGKLSLREAWMGMWSTNVVGAHIMSHTFMPLLIKSKTPRLIFITSGTSSLIETQNFDGPLARINASPKAGWPKPAEANPVIGYRSSKTGMNMLVTQWARVLREDGVKVFAVSPGFLATNLNSLSGDALRKMGAIEPHIGGEFLRDVIVGRRDDQTVRMIRKDAVQPW
ncbi:hypothetical protein AMS68_005084 [Peltaster fructicola]|uniref:NAD(P)-binding protein n=1 Tax=Peltaster fructicola TaxID=286661 RepID=A0A6H0XXR5_9PEZI|nr:hypothetical protein AMS68_005084 [Peltaster fructicola]